MMVSKRGLLFWGADFQVPCKKIRDAYSKMFFFMSNWVANFGCQFRAGGREWWEIRSNPSPRDFSAEHRSLGDEQVTWGIFFLGWAKLAKLAEPWQNPQSSAINPWFINQSSASHMSNLFFCKLGLSKDAQSWSVVLHWLQGQNFIVKPVRIPKMLGMYSFLQVSHESRQSKGRRWCHATFRQELKSKEAGTAWDDPKISCWSFG